MDGSKVLLQLPWRYDNTTLQLEAGSYRGHPTFRLRRVWRHPDGQSRWRKVEPDSKGRHWEALGIKPKELEDLGRALIEAAGTQLIEQSESDGDDLSEFETPRAARVG